MHIFKLRSPSYIKYSDKTADADWGSFNSISDMCGTTTVILGHGSGLTHRKAKGCLISKEILFQTFFLAA